MSIDLNFNGGEGAEPITYGDVFLQAEQEYSRYNFEYADTEMLKRHFDDAETECRAAGAATTAAAWCLPAYDQCIKASHAVQSARCARRHLGDRAAGLYPRACATLPKACGEAWLETAGRRRAYRTAAADAGAADRASLRGDSGPDAGARRGGSAVAADGGPRGAGLWLRVRAPLQRRAGSLVAVDGLPRPPPTRREERKGPRIDAPRSAIEGFLVRPASSLDQCSVVEDRKGRSMWRASSARAGTPEIRRPIACRDHAEISLAEIHALGLGELRWVRPLHSILVHFRRRGGAVRASTASQAGDNTRGHRFMAPRPNHRCAASRIMKRSCAMPGSCSMARSASDTIRRGAERSPSPRARSDRGRGAAQGRRPALSNGRWC